MHEAASDPVGDRDRHDSATAGSWLVTRPATLALLLAAATAVFATIDFLVFSKSGVPGYAGATRPTLVVPTGASLLCSLSVLVMRRWPWFVMLMALVTLGISTFSEALSPITYVLLAVGGAVVGTWARHAVVAVPVAETTAVVATSLLPGHDVGAVVHESFLSVLIMALAVAVGLTTRNQQRVMAHLWSQHYQLETLQRRETDAAVARETDPDRARASRCSGTSRVGSTHPGPGRPTIRETGRIARDADLGGRSRTLPARSCCRCVVWWICFAPRRTAPLPDRRRGRPPALGTRSPTWPVFLGWSRTSPGMTGVGEASNGKEGTELVARTAPDIAVMDLRMPVLDGIEATSRIVASAAAIQILVLTTFDEEELVYQALETGAAGFLMKDASPDEMITAIRTVHRGHSILSPEVTRAVIARNTAANPPVGTVDPVLGC